MTIQPCSVCGEPAATIMYDTNSAAPIALSPTMPAARIQGYYCTEHNPIVRLFISTPIQEEAPTKYQFKWFLDRLYFDEQCFSVSDIQRLLEEPDFAKDCPPTLRQWIEEWVEE